MRGLSILILIAGLSVYGCSDDKGISSIASPSRAEAVTTQTGTFMTGATITKRSATGLYGVVSASCKSTEVVVGGGCVCIGLWSDNEAGVLFGCASYQNGYAGACYPYGSSQILIPIGVEVQCAQFAYNNAVVSVSKPSESLEAEELEGRYLQMIQDYKTRK